MLLKICSPETARLTERFQVLAKQISDLDTGAAGRASEFGDIERRAALIDLVLATQAHLDAESEGWRAVIGPPFDGAHTDFGAVRVAAEWLNELERMRDGDLTAPLREQLLLTDERHWPDFDALDAACERLRTVAQQLTAMFDDSRRQDLWDTVASRPFAVVQELAKQMSDTVDELRDWTEWRVGVGAQRRTGGTRLLTDLSIAVSKKLTFCPVFGAPTGIADSSTSTTRSPSLERTCVAPPFSVGSTSSEHSTSSL